MTVDLKSVDAVSLDFDKEYILLPYSPDNLAWAFLYSKKVLSLEENNRVFPESKIKNSPLYKYFVKFFDYQSFADKNVVYQAKTILIEKKFVSKSFLNDIKNFYFDCFSDYNKFCARIHFFGNFAEELKINDSGLFLSKLDFERLIIKNENKELFTKTYLGHITVKPTGNSIIGPTYLRPYPNIDKLRIRNYNSIVPVEFNLFGKSFFMESLIFQEQDQTIGLCATQAVWFSIHSLSNIFRTPVLFPADISIRAGFNKEAGRFFPNAGLTNLQIYSIFQSLDLSSVVYQPQIIRSTRSLEQIIYSYNKLGIPILIGYKESGSEKKNRHMVTIIGYRIDEKESIIDKGTMPVYGSRIKRLFCHDDQEGPYQKIEIISDSTQQSSCKLKIDFEKDNTTKQVEVTTVIIPIKNSIRIRLEHVEASVMAFDEFHRLFLKKSKDAHRYKNYEWDIYLEKAIDYKAEIINNREQFYCSDDLLKKIAFTSFPKYIWVARLYCYQNKSKTYLYDIIYDSSESPATSNFCIFKLFFHSYGYGNEVREFINKEKSYLHAIAALSSKMRFSDQHINIFNKMLDL